jgi:NAD-dependent SIR2 family protein deacetylase
LPSVLEIPPVPPELKTAAKQGRLVIFVGAGISRFVGGPSWAEFADGLLRQLASKEHLSFGEVKQLELLDAKKKISIACDVCEADGFSPDYKSLLMPPPPASVSQSIYDDLYSIGTAFVTTNYDEWLDHRAEQTHPARSDVGMEGEAGASASVVPREKKRVFFLKTELTVDRLTVPGNVVHLHGSLRDATSMVLTTRNYLEHYLDPIVTAFLGDLFSKYVVLFVGYGVEEDEIVEHILRKVKPSGPVSSAAVVAHYRLVPRYGHEDLLFARLARYYRTHRGVQLIGYSVDRQGDRQLLDVVASWSKELQQHVGEQGFLEKARLIDEAVAEADDD